MFFYVFGGWILMGVIGLNLLRYANKVPLRMNGEEIFFALLIWPLGFIAFFLEWDSKYNLVRRYIEWLNG